jgi:hypothetical protein
MGVSNNRGVIIQRRSFLSLAITAASAAARGQSLTPNGPSLIHPVLSGEDRLDEARSLGTTSIAFKVLTRDTNGDLFIIEHYPPEGRPDSTYSSAFG